MLRSTNLKSLIQAKQRLAPDVFKSYLKHLNASIKDYELEDLAKLVEQLSTHEGGALAFDGFFVGYKIPQIGKEFDLLRFCKDGVINIEIKRKASRDKIAKQLKRNRYYLSPTGDLVETYLFVAESREFFGLNLNDELEIVDACQINVSLHEREFDSVCDPDQVFEPGNFLVSPFNSTEKFLEGQFFLTHQQEEILVEVISKIENTGGPNFISIEGAAGTGKTLLSYSLAMELQKSQKRVLIIHCGKLNSGHLSLIEAGWVITSVKNYSSKIFDEFSCIIVDESQRLRNGQLEDIKARVETSKANCLFSFDRRQTLASFETNSGVTDEILNLPNVKNYKLTEKIRTNREISDFIKGLFDGKRNTKCSSGENVSLLYFEDAASAQEYLSALDPKRTTVLNFTPSRYQAEYHERYAISSANSSHGVIGQEFDSVTVVVDDFFQYDESGYLVYFGKTYYDPSKMLFQNITRTRKELTVVFVGNADLFKRCMKLLSV
ncbi:DUF2075 domain-containing protein [Shimia sp. R10_1]|uniref:DNA/RNA helicase domain-containing protein n=1 Tax=Shimia sp. R10_1 TaxID=2821095 RepID=UPI001ADA7A88|nr:DNA/RNA helicase domain-containing protein [Shimia sp. R10_1]MBO9475343.1 DUF2075 domain-containing protein [Shimia sp. R10_1]